MIIKRGKELLKQHKQEKIGLVNEEIVKVNEDIAQVKQLAKMFECESLLEKLNNGEVIIKEVEADTTKLEEKIAKSTKRIEQLEAQAKTLIMDKDAAESKVKDLNQQIETLTKEKNNAQVQISELEAKIKELENKAVKTGFISVSKKAFEQLQKDVKDYQDQIQSLEDKLLQMAHTNNPFVCTTDDNIDDLKAELKRAYDRMATLECDIAKAESSRDGYKSTAEDMSKKNRELIRKNEELKEQLQVSNNSNTNDQIKSLEKLIAGKDKLINDLEQKLSDEAYQAANDGYLVDGVEVSIRVVEALEDEITELDEELTILEDENEKLKKQLEQALKDAESYKQSMATWQGKYTALVNSMKEKVTDKPVNNTQAVGATKDTKKDKEVVKNNSKNQNKDTKNKDNKISNKVIGKVEKLVPCKNYKHPRAEVAMYDGGDYYVMASKTCQQITVLPCNSDIVVTEEVEKAYEKQLVTMGYQSERPNVSPIVVRHEEGTKSGYLARVEGKFGITEFSDEDTLAGYVYIGKTCYLYTWNRQEFAIPVVYTFDNVLNNTPDYVPENVKSNVASFVKAMYQIYEPQAKKRMAEIADKIKENTKASQEFINKQNKEKAMLNNQMNESISNGNVLGSVVTNNNGGGRTRKSQVKNNADINKGGGDNTSGLSSSMQTAAKLF